MKTALILILLIIISCKESIVEKPKRFIEKEQMMNIMYDMTIAESIAYKDSIFIQKTGMTPTRFVFKKYGIDSAQYVQNNTYYVSNYKEYKEMMAELSKRISTEVREMDSLQKIKNTPKKTKKSKVIKKK